MAAGLTVIETLAMDDDEWLQEIQAAEGAIEALLKAKRRVLFSDPVREHLLWTRYRPRLLMLKRKMDAISI